MSKKNKDNELSIIRIYNTPIKYLWDAWTDLNQVSKWWGPRGFSITTHEKDLKTNGFWHYTMHGPDGVNYPNKTKYLEVIPYQKLVYDHGGNDEQAPLFRVTAIFTDLGEKSNLEMTMSFGSAEIAREMSKFIKAANGNSTWDRLAEYLGETKDQKNIFVINRSFTAPIEAIYNAFTLPELMTKWLSPAGTTLTFIRSDIQVNKSSFSKVDGPHGAMYSRVHYLELNRPSRILYTQQFVDENEKITRHPMAASWPETMLTLIELNVESENETRVTITWEPYGQCTTEEINTFKNARAGMTQGWNGTLDKIEEVLNSI